MVLHVLLATDMTSGRRAGQVAFSSTSIVPKLLSPTPCKSMNRMSFRESQFLDAVRTYATARGVAGWCGKIDGREMNCG